MLWGGRPDAPSGPGGSGVTMSSSSALPRGTDSGSRTTLGARPVGWFGAVLGPVRARPRMWRGRERPPTGVRFTDVPRSQRDARIEVGHEERGPGASE